MFANASVKQHKTLSSQSAFHYEQWDPTPTARVGTVLMISHEIVLCLYLYLFSRADLEMEKEKRSYISVHTLNIPQHSLSYVSRGLCQ